MGDPVIGSFFSAGREDIRDAKMSPHFLDWKEINFLPLFFFFLVCHETFLLPTYEQQLWLSAYMGLNQGRQGGMVTSWPEDQCSTKTVLLEPVWSDWAILKIVLVKKFHTKVVQISGDFLGSFDNVTL